MLRTEYIATVPELLAGHARARPERIAYIDDERAVSYGELASTTRRLAGHLRRIGIERGDRVLLYLDNRVEVAESYLAAPRAGAVAVCVNPRAPAGELGHILADSAARVVLTDAAHLAIVRQLLAGGGEALAIIVVGRDGGEAVSPTIDDTGGKPAGVPELNYAELLRAEPEREPRDCLGLDDPAWMLYTSGTTGRPKGVYLTQRGCFWVVAACWAPITGLGPEDALLSALPLFHSYALDLCVLGVLAVGASARILSRFSLGDITDRFAGGPEGDITVFPGVPTMFRDLLERAGDKELKAPALRVCISAGAILGASLNQWFERVFGVPLLDGYGITETSTMVTMNWPTGTRVMGSCGLPLPGLTVRLVDPASGKDVAPGEDGEVWVQGPNVTPGYHNLPEATAAVLIDGWYRTGDLARRDQNGYLRISGRIKELIIRGGENIYPAEVEDALIACDQVLDAAVVGIPDERLGEVAVAFVVPVDPGSLDHDAVVAHARQRLSPFKVPVRLIETAQIPRTGSGKILRFKLQQQLRATTGSAAISQPRRVLGAACTGDSAKER